MGYYRAGFDVVGVDIEPQPRFPFRFIQADALEFVETYGRCFEAIHASPPCQAYSATSSITGNRANHPDLVESTRHSLRRTGVPWIIENVVRSPVLNPIKLCGTMFGLRIYRHRLFESSELLYEPPHPRHTAKVCELGYAPAPDEFHCVVGHFGDMPAARLAMGIHWMNRHELANAIPPTYTEWIGRQLMASVIHNRGQRAHVAAA